MTELGPLVDAMMAMRRWRIFLAILLFLAGMTPAILMAMFPGDPTVGDPALLWSFVLIGVSLSGGALYAAWRIKPHHILSQLHNIVEVAQRHTRLIDARGEMIVTSLVIRTRAGKRYTIVAKPMQLKSIYKALLKACPDAEGNRVPTAIAGKSWDGF